MRAAAVTAALALFLAGCPELSSPGQRSIGSFTLNVTGIYQSATGTTPRRLLPVNAACIAKFGSDSSVPLEVRGTAECPHPMPRGEVEIEVAIGALGPDGSPTAVSLPVWFRVVPGDLAGNFTQRYVMMQDGHATAVVRASHLYGEVRVWAEDSPPNLSAYDAGTVTDPTPKEHVFSFATGLSRALVFEEPTIARLQIPDTADNRSSPLVGQFITLGRPPESGKLLRHTCPDDPEHDGMEAFMVVTGTDPSGFFVTDLNSCRIKEDLPADRIREPLAVIDGGVASFSYLPGTYGSLFIYNYSHPEGLFAGDTVWTVSGAVQEFSATTQLTFPSWSLRERMHLKPAGEQDAYLKRITPAEVSLRSCGLDVRPFINDPLCGFSSRNLKLESLESSLVKIRNVRMPHAFVDCDLNRDTSVPFFCSNTMAGTWGACGDVESEDDAKERQCNQECVLGARTDGGTSLCTELTTFKSFAQYVVEMAPPGPEEAQLDNSIPDRWEKVTLFNPSGAADGGTNRPAAQTAFGERARVAVWCSMEVAYKFGAASVSAATSDPHLPARTLLSYRLAAGESAVAFLPVGAIPSGAYCSVSLNPGVRINLSSRDAWPDFSPQCATQEEDPSVSAAASTDCKNLRGATYDVVGHLRQVQAARPRWMLLPRDTKDVCCRPGPGLSCPTSIPRCP